MNIGYKQKPCLFKRMWNNIFQKTKLIDSIPEYTQKEVKVKAYEIINCLKNRDEYKNKSN